MSPLSYRRLSVSNAADVAECQRVFREAPSFVYPTGGRQATDDEVAEMLNRVPAGLPRDDIHLYAIVENANVVGCSVTARGYPHRDTAFVVLLLFIQSAQGRSLGKWALKQIEAQAKSWGCGALAAAVDSKNERALRFWLREGFVEQFRKPAEGFIGHAVAITKTIGAWSTPS